MASKIFISYRHGNDADAAARLRTAAVSYAGGRKVFWDSEIAPGDDFVESIAMAARGDVLVLAVIGQDWSSAANLDRLQRPDDWVRRELEAGSGPLTGKVVPVLVNGTTWPPASGTLPDSLRPLETRRAWAISKESFERDVDHMLKRLGVKRWYQTPLRVCVAGCLLVMLLVALWLVAGRDQDNGGSVSSVETTVAPASNPTSTPRTTPTTTGQIEEVLEEPAESSLATRTTVLPETTTTLPIVVDTSAVAENDLDRYFELIARREYSEARTYFTPSFAADSPLADFVAFWGTRVSSFDVQITGCEVDERGGTCTYRFSVVYSDEAAEEYRGRCFATEIELEMLESSGRYLIDGQRTLGNLECA